MSQHQPEHSSLEHLYLKEDNTFFKYFILQGGENDLFGLEQHPGIVEAAGFCICLEGEGELIIESRSYSLKQGYMCVFFPNDILFITKKSADFKGYTVVCTPDFYNTIYIASGTSIYMYVKDNPCISLEKQEQDNLIRICENLKVYDSQKDHPCREEIFKHFAAIIFYEIIGAYKKGTPLAQQPYSRKYKLLFEFMELVVKNCRQQRGIEFYADKLCVSSRHLSSISKEIAGQTAKDYLNDYIITNIRILLATSDLTISQISDEFNFPNASFFSKFFKQKTGMTPKEYRNVES
jgi:AraC-like DNA-binding protein